jgi:hypothetical protein
MGYDLELGFWLSVIRTIVAPLKYYLTKGCGGDSHAETDRKDLGVFSPLMAVVADGSSGGAFKTVNSYSKSSTTRKAENDFQEHC